MIIRSACYIDAVDHLPPTALLVFPQVAWEEYEELLQDLGDQPGLRVSYDEGRLEIMSPLPSTRSTRKSSSAPLCSATRYTTRTALPRCLPRGK